MTLKLEVSVGYQTNSRRDEAVDVGRRMYTMVRNANIPRGYEIVEYPTSIVVRPKADVLPQIKIMWTPMAIHHDFGTRRNPKSKIVAITNTGHLVDELNNIFKEC